MIKVLKIIKKIIFSLCLLFGLNMILQRINLNLAINLISVLTITILDFPGLLLLIFIKYYIF